MKITKDEIIDLEHRLINGITMNDVAFLNQILHDDLLFITPNGQVITKQMDLASHRAKEMVVDQIIPTLEQINLIDDCAIVTIVYNAKGKMLDMPVDGKFRYIRIWKKSSEGCKVIAGGCYQI